MDVNIWENTIVAWLNLLSSSSPIDSVNQIDESILKEVIQKISKNSESSPVQFLKGAFQNLAESDSFNLLLGVDYFCASTLLLMFVSLSKEEELNEIRDLMCVKLDTSTQVNIVQFLKEIEVLIQEHEDLFNLSYEKFKFHIFPSLFFNFKEKHCTQKLEIGDGVNTPVKNDMSNISLNSPLQGFFMTPKRSGKKNSKNTYGMCGDGDYVKRIKKLTDQLVEEETEKTSLQEQLKIQTFKCNELELKLRSKVEEMIHLKEEWEKESKKNENENNLLRNKFMEKLEIEKKLRSDLTYLENYLAKLELDQSSDAVKIGKLESQLKTALEKLAANETELKETSELCVKLQARINEKESELEQFREHYANFYQDEKAVDVSFINGSFDKSVYTPENLAEVVVDKLLREKIEENAELLRTVEELKAEKSKLIDKVKELNDGLATNNFIASELEFLKKELSTKVENLEKSEKELFRLQKDLVNANAEITKLNKENFHLIEKYNVLNSKVQEREQVLKKCNHSKMLLQINFLKIAQDFKAVQQRLESEVKYMSMLAQEKYAILLKTESDLKFSDMSEILNKKNLNICWEGDSFRTEEKTLSQLDCFFEDGKRGKLQELSQNVENQVEWIQSKALLEKTCNQLNDHIVVLKAKTREFAELQKKFVETNSQLGKNLKEAEEKIASSSCEIKKLTQELEAKENKIKELEVSFLRSKKIQDELYLETNVKAQEVKMSRGKEQKVIPEGGDHERIRTVAVDDLKVKIEPPSERQEFSDSLEEVPVNNKTFDIVHVEERNSDKTFSLKTGSVETFNKNSKSNSAWVVSPPSKVPLKIQSKESIKDNRRVQGESWLIPSHPRQSKENKLKRVSSSFNDLRIKTNEEKITGLQKPSTEFLKENERLKAVLTELMQKRKKDKELVEKNQELLRQSITIKYETQLEHLKTEMKQLYNRELAKHKHEQSGLISELQDQNKRYKEHIDELRNQLWDLGEKLLQEQTANRDWRRTFTELKEKYEYTMFSKESDLRSLHLNDLPCQKELLVDENIGTSRIPNVTFPTMPTEDEDEVFDNRFLEDMKLGLCKTERPEDRLKELQYRNSLCLPHLKSSYPGETQFHNPSLFKEIDLKFGVLPFSQESQSLTDSDHSMTKSLLPEKGKKKEQTSYKRPGPPTPSKNGGRLSIQGGDLRGTPRTVLKELNDQNERNKGTPNPLKLLLTSKSSRTLSLGGKDENTAPVTPRKKNFFRKPFGARDH